MIARSILLYGAMTLALASTAFAGTSTPCDARTVAATVTSRWPAPLDRVVSLQARDVSLRDALGRLAAAARISLSYSAELLPLDRRVCVTYDSAAVGDALAELLQGTRVEPRVVSGDYVALAPVRTTPSQPDATVVRTARVLDQIVVTGSPAGAPQRPLAVSVTS